jgi:hypothetical protein
MQQPTERKNTAGAGLIVRCLRWWQGHEKAAVRACCSGNDAPSAGEPQSRSLAGKWPDAPVWPVPPVARGSDVSREQR